MRRTERYYRFSMNATGRTIVIEEDVHVLDAATRELAPRAGGLIARLPADHEAVEAESSVVRSWVPAGLTRVAPAGSMIVNSSRGGGGKDTWILRPPARADRDPR